MLWHGAGLTVLGLVVAGLVLRLCFAWAFTDAGSSRALDSKKAEYEALVAQTAPLHGLEKRVDATRDRIAEFYEERIPASYSLVATRISELEVHSGARLSRIAYTQGPPGIDLTEISMDAAISGDYPQIMRFVNGLERDKVFFIIRAMQLNSQQGGIVTLRIRVSTWLRSADAAASGLPAMAPENRSSASNSNAGKEGY